MFISNGDIYRKLGVQTKVIETIDQIKQRNPRWQGSKFHVLITNKAGVKVHDAYYNDPDDYNYIIEHCVEIGALRNLVEIVNTTRKLIEEIPELKEFIINE